MKIAILGSAPSSVNLAPYKNSQHQQWVEGKVDDMAVAHAQIRGDFQVWGCSPGAWAVCTRATRWFELHRWEPQQAWFSPEYCQFLRNFKGIVYTGGKIPEIPNHQVYPLERMEEKFSSYFMRSSVSLMLALAIDTIEALRVQRKEYQKTRAQRGEDSPPTVEELAESDEDDVIGLWGIDMAAHDEYSYQRPGCQFFVLEAMRRGIGVYLPPESDLMRPAPVYGISEWDHNYIKLTSRSRELNQKAQNYQRQMEEAKTQLVGVQGEMSALAHFVDTWTSPYGMLPGVVARQSEGTGMGTGITHLDSRPIARMNVAEAMEAPEESALARELIGRLLGEATKIGVKVASPQEVLGRIIDEATMYRRHAAYMQPYITPGEGTPDALQRLLSRDEGSTTYNIPKRRRKPRRHR